MLGLASNMLFGIDMKRTIISSVLCLVLGLNACVALCDDAGETPGPVPPKQNGPGFSRGADTVRVLKSLITILAVLGALVAANYYIRKKTAASPGGRVGRINVLERVHVDARRQLLLVRVGGREILVGVGAHEMRMLAELEEEKASEFKKA